MICLNIIQKIKSKKVNSIPTQDWNLGLRNRTSPIMFNLSSKCFDNCKLWLNMLQLCLPSCRPGFESQAHHLSFINLYLNFIMCNMFIKTKINKKSCFHSRKDYLYNLMWKNLGCFLTKHNHTFLYQQLSSRDKIFCMGWPRHAPSRVPVWVLFVFKRRAYLSFLSEMYLHLFFLVISLRNRIWWDHFS